MGTYLALGDDTSKAGDLAVNSVNWNATAAYCSNFTNEKVEYESASVPCAASTAKPEFCEPTCDIYEVNYEAWKPKTAIPNPAFTGKVISVGLTYVQSKGGSDRVPSLQLRQSDGSVVDSMYSHPGSTNPVGFYETYEPTIQGIAITRSAFFTVSKAVSSGNVVVSDYDFGQYPTRGLYKEAWLVAN